VTDSGDPALKITQFAHSNAVDLIMMPTHGCGLFRNLLIGSVTAKVLHDAKCPVWTATHAEEQRSKDLPRTILCAVDGTPKSAALMRWAAQFSQGMGAAVRLLHVVPPITDWLALPGERELQEQLREEARARIDCLKQSAGVDLPVRVAVGPIADTVTEEARQEGADLVVIGRGSLQASMGRLRTHAYGIIQKSPCPVLSV
jgi:nucleotide-binding universal stress UspA family protein